jgi:hypothetical protein
VRLETELEAGAIDQQQTSLRARNVLSASACQVGQAQSACVCDRCVDLVLAYRGQIHKPRFGANTARANTRVFEQLHRWRTDWAQAAIAGVVEQIAAKLA